MNNNTLPKQTMKKNEETDLTSLDVSRGAAEDRSERMARSCMDHIAEEWRRSESIFNNKSTLSPLVLFKVNLLLFLILKSNNYFQKYSLYYVYIYIYIVAEQCQHLYTDPRSPNVLLKGLVIVIGVLSLGRFSACLIMPIYLISFLLYIYIF